MSAVLPFTAVSWVGWRLRETDDGIIFMDLKQKVRKGSEYQQFLSDDEDRRAWEYQQITKTGEEMHVEKKGKG